ncbi:MAG TPA: SpoIIIAH-like family protein [Paenibacillus cookii]|nr:Stage III sporulation protein AH [Paenibacillus sp. P1XP2]HWO54799.1 SpoIIIAH-like family protein [Paenibacillus cookii]
MNSKRQTIWLVSMLSLMVVLSAYYLFTEDSGSSKTPKTPVADSQQVSGADKSSAKETASKTTTESGVELTEVITDGKVNENAAAAKTDAGSADASKEAAKDTAKDTTKDAAKDASKESSDKTTAKTDGKDAAKDTAAEDKSASAGKTDSGKEAQAGKSDDEVLKEVAAQKSTASSQFDSFLMEREQKNQSKYNDLLAAMNDMSKDPSETAKASEELNALETKADKITGIEEELEHKYSFANAFIKEENDKYQVLVLSDKPDVKQAVSIVELVMKELNVTQDKVSVQYMAP